MAVENKPKNNQPSLAKTTVIQHSLSSVPGKPIEKAINKDGKEDEEKKLDWKNLLLEEKMVGEPQNIPQSVIYELINETLNTDPQNLAVPKKEEKKIETKVVVKGKNEPKEKKQNYTKEWLIYIAKIPLTHLQYITIPDPLSNRNKNFYPLSLLMSTMWIFAYSYIVTWFTYELSMKWLYMEKDAKLFENTIPKPTVIEVKEGDEVVRSYVIVPMYSLIPMFIYPIGISFRDSKKFEDFEKCMGVFKQELKDQ